MIVWEEGPSTDSICYRTGLLDENLDISMPDPPRRLTHDGGNQQLGAASVFLTNPPETNSTACQLRVAVRRYALGRHVLRVL